jgi:hypothetical protein
VRIACSALQENELVRRVQVCTMHWLRQDQDPACSQPVSTCACCSSALGLPDEPCNTPTTLQAWLGQHAPEALESLLSGADEELLNEVEAELGAPLPAALRALYRYNGWHTYPAHLTASCGFWQG